MNLVSFDVLAIHKDVPSADAVTESIVMQTTPRGNPTRQGKSLSSKLGTTRELKAVSGARYHEHRQGVIARFSAGRALPGFSHQSLTLPAASTSMYTYLSTNVVMPLVASTWTP